MDLYKCNCYKVTDIINYYYYICPAFRLVAGYLCALLALFHRSSSSSSSSFVVLCIVTIPKIVVVVIDGFVLFSFCCRTNGTYLTYDNSLTDGKSLINKPWHKKEAGSTQDNQCVASSSSAAAAWRTLIVGKKRRRRQNRESQRRYSRLHHRQGA